MLERFLVPLDTTEVAEQVLPYVVLLAKQLGQPVVLQSVVEDGEELNPLASLYDAEIVSLREKQRAYARRYLSQVQARLEGQAVAVTTDVATGPVAPTILEAAASHQAGLIAMATHGRVGPERWFLGSVAEKVVRTASMPVLLVRPQEDAAPVASIQRVLLPLDGSAMAQTALPVATFLAKAFAVPITVVRTVNLTSLAAASASDPYLGYGGIPQSLIDALEEDARKQLDAVATKLQGEGIPATTRFSFLPPAEEITELARAEAGTIVVMCTHGRSGLSRAVLGSVADRVVRSSVAPVLLVRGQE